MALTVQMIESKEFSRAAMGYNRKEVDEFLDEICDEMDRLHEEIAGLQMRLSKAGQTQVFKTHPGAVPAPSAAAPARRGRPGSARSRDARDRKAG